MQKQCAMILFNLDDSGGGRARILKLVLYEFQMNRRGDRSFGFVAAALMVSSVLA